MLRGSPFYDRDKNRAFRGLADRGELGQRHREYARLDWMRPQRATAWRDIAGRRDANAARDFVREEEQGGDLEHSEYLRSQIASWGAAPPAPVSDDHAGWLRRRGHRVPRRPEGGFRPPPPVVTNDDGGGILGIGDRLKAELESLVAREHGGPHAPVLHPRMPSPEVTIAGECGWRANDEERATGGFGEDPCTPWNACGQSGASIAHGEFGVAPPPPPGRVGAPPPPNLGAMSYGTSPRPAPPNLTMINHGVPRPPMVHVGAPGFPHAPMLPGYNPHGYSRVWPHGYRHYLPPVQTIDTTAIETEGVGVGRSYIVRNADSNAYLGRVLADDLGRAGRKAAKFWPGQRLRIKGPFSGGQDTTSSTAGGTGDGDDKGILSSIYDAVTSLVSSKDDNDSSGDTTTATEETVENDDTGGSDLSGEFGGRGAPGAFLRGGRPAAPRLGRGRGRYGWGERGWGWLADVDAEDDLNPDDPLNDPKYDVQVSASPMAGEFGYNYPPPPPNMGNRPAPPNLYGGGRPAPPRGYGGAYGNPYGRPMPPASYPNAAWQGRPAAPQMGGNTWARWQQVHPGTSYQDYQNWYFQYGAGGGQINGELQELHKWSSGQHSDFDGGSPFSFAGEWPNDENEGDFTSHFGLGTDIPSSGTSGRHANRKDTSSGLDEAQVDSINGEFGFLPGNLRQRGEVREVGWSHRRPGYTFGGDMTRHPNLRGMRL